MTLLFALPALLAAFRLLALLMRLVPDNADVILRRLAAVSVVVLLEPVGTVGFRIVAAAVGVICLIGVSFR